MRGQSKRDNPRCSHFVQEVEPEVRNVFNYIRYIFNEDLFLKLSTSVIK